MTGQPPATTAELLERITRGYSDLTSALSDLSGDEWLAPNTIGDWSVRDVVAHIGGDEMWMAGQLEALRFEQMPTAESCYGIDLPPPPDMDWSQDGRKAWQRERLAKLSLDDVRSMATESHRRLLGVISTFTDNRLTEPLAIGELKTVGWVRPPQGSEPAYPLWEWIRGVTYHHYDEHADAIRKRRRQQEGPTR